MASDFGRDPGSFALSFAIPIWLSARRLAAREASSPRRSATSQRRGLSVRPAACPHAAGAHPVARPSPAPEFSAVTTGDGAAAGPRASSVPAPVNCREHLGVRGTRTPSPVQLLNASRQRLKCEPDEPVARLGAAPLRCRPGGCSEQEFNHFPAAWGQLSHCLPYHLFPLQLRQHVGWDGLHGAKMLDLVLLEIPFLF